MGGQAFGRFSNYNLTKKTQLHCEYCVFKNALLYSQQL